MSDRFAYTTGPMPARRVLLVAAWFGLATGFSEAVLLGVKRLALGRHIRFGPDVVWMAPLADAALFLLAALALLAAARYRPALRSFRIVIGVFASLALLSVFHLYYPLHLLAKLLLSAGLAVQAARVIGRWPARAETVVRRTAPWLAGAALVLAAAVPGVQALAFRRHVGALPPAAPSTPNVLLIVLDTVRAQNLSLYGYARQTTPALERWAASSLVFDRALSTAPWTLPAHASMFTGRWPHEQSSRLGTPFDDSYPTLAEALAGAGYVTAGFVANTFYCGYEFGLARGFSHYEDYVRSPRELLISSSLSRSVLNARATRQLLRYYDNIPRRNAVDITNQFLAWLPRADGRPFFAFLNYFDAHETYLPPAPFATRFGPDLPRGNHLLSQDLRRSLRDDWHLRPRQEIETEIDMYDGAIAFLDHQLDRLFTTLAGRGILDNTLVIVTSDHGELFGEHGLFLHGQALYMPLIHVPLVLRYPARVPADRRIADPVSLGDLPATVMDIVGVPSRTPFPGRSLSSWWSGPPVRQPNAPILSGVRGEDWGGKDWYPIAKGDMYSLVDRSHHYIRNGDDREELYLLDTDPQEHHDLSGSKDAVPVLERFRAHLEGVVGGSTVALTARPAPGGRQD